MDECVFLSIPTIKGKVLFFVLLFICFYDTLFSFTLSLPLLNIPKSSGCSTWEKLYISTDRVTLNWANTITLIYQGLLEETKAGIEV